MEKTPGLVAVTKFVRPGSAVYASYINYMDRDEAVHGGEIHPDYSAYSENYMGNPEKTTGLFSMAKHLRSAVPPAFNPYLDHSMVIT